MIGNAFCFIEDEIEALYELDNMNNKYAKNLAHYLNKYTFGSDELYELLMTAYVLTPKGRNDFYKKMADPNYSKSSKNCLEKFKGKCYFFNTL